jgi:hypothetical protein
LQFGEVQEDLPGDLDRLESAARHFAADRAGGQGPGGRQVTGGFGKRQERVGIVEAA